MRPLLGLLLGLWLLASGGLAMAQQNPLLGTPAPAEAPPPAASGAGPLHRLEALIIATQRDVNREIDRRLIAVRDGHGLGVILAGLVIAFLYGVFHALGPGHGKTVIVGYFLGRGGSIGRGVAMAGWIALSHVIGAVIIVTVAHFMLARSLATPVEETRWLQLVSYAAILAIGIAMLVNTLRQRRRGDVGLCRHHPLDRRHDHGRGSAHAPGALREQRLLAVAAGFIPCSGAILILVFAFTNGILMSGILMALAIALGMGITLALLGIASVVTRRQAALRLAGTEFAGIRGVDPLLALLGPILISAIGALLLSGALLASS
jgi:nickel/cobalt transporter (NicO) family protein